MSSIVWTGQPIEVDEKQPKGWPKYRWVDTLDRKLKALQANARNNGATDDDNPTPHVNGTKSKEKKKNYASLHIFLRGKCNASVLCFSRCDTGSPLLPACV